MNIKLELSMEQAATLLRAVEDKVRQMLKVLIEDSDPLKCKIASREVKILNDIGDELDRQIDEMNELTKHP